MPEEKPIEKKPEMKFCRLCGKNRPVDDICDIILSIIDKHGIVYKGCKACATVIHNAHFLIQETIEREQKKIQDAAQKQIAENPRISQALERCIVCGCDNAPGSRKSDECGYDL